MKPLDFMLLLVILIFIFAGVNNSYGRINADNDRNFRNFEQSFIGAVDDTGAYLALLEAQQSQEGVRYSKEKQLTVNLDMINMFYDNLSMRFGVEGDPIALQNIMMHIPGMVITRYDGFQLITLEDNISTEGGSSFVPKIHPIKPFSYTLPTGVIVYFTLDDNMTLYDPSTNQYLEGTYQTLSVARDLSPMTDYARFSSLRNRTIKLAINEDLAGAINSHMELIAKIGLKISFNLPSTEEESISNVGFMAFIQGYPLPGGQELTSFSFGAGSVSKNSEYIAVIRSDGRHVAYEARCGIPRGSSIIERIFNAKEAARKGYFVQDCPI
jgi:hypothetical protein